MNFLNTNEDSNVYKMSAYPKDTGKIIAAEIMVIGVSVFQSLYQHNQVQSKVNAITTAACGVTKCRNDHNKWIRMAPVYMWALTNFQGVRFV